MSGSILCAREGSIVTLTLSNPGKLNAVDFSMWQTLAETMTRLSADTEVRCVILRGEGDQAFAAGGDLKEFLVRRDTVEHAMQYHGQVGVALRAIADCRHPTIAAIQGACVGGGMEIAGNCDLRLCGESSRFGAPINKLGFSMYPEEMEGLIRLLGSATVLEILLEGRILDAKEAFAKGLVNRVAPDEKVIDEARASAQRICDGAPLVASWHKQWVRRLQHDVPLSEEEKRDSFAFLTTEDYQEGLAAFFAKRRPDFKGR